MSLKRVEVAKRSHRDRLCFPVNRDVCERKSKNKKQLKSVWRLYNISKLKTMNKSTKIYTKGYFWLGLESIFEKIVLRNFLQFPGAELFIDIKKKRGIVR